MKCTILLLLLSLIKTTPSSPIKKILVKKKIELLKANFYHPSLRVKKIKASTNLFECSVNMDIRIIFVFEGNNIIALLDIGHHDILDKY